MGQASRLRGSKKRPRDASGSTHKMPTDRSLDIPVPTEKAGAKTLAAIFAGESLLRSMNVTVIPLQAYELLGSSQRVSIVATSVSLLVLVTTLLLPLMLRGVRRRWVYSLGIGLVMLGALLFASHTIGGQVSGAYLRGLGAAVMSVTLSLYIMDHIPRVDLTWSEPLRLAFSTVSWTIGPAAGAWVFTHYGPIWAQMTVLGVGLVLLVGFWVARLVDPATLPPGNLSGFSPLSNAIAFIQQPRLRLAWAIAFARSCFWSGMFIYSPLFFLEGGLSKTTAGLLLSASQLALPASLLFGKIAAIKGVRWVIALCFSGMSLLCLAAGFFGETRIAFAASALLLASFFSTGLDGVGGIPFLRAVKPRQRREMTSVYRTYIECSDLVPGFIFMGLLLIFPTGIVFIVLSGLMLFMALLVWKYLPKSM
jgi:MFS family permease